MNTTYEDRNFIIFPVSQLDKIEFDTVCETSIYTVRKSVDGSKTFIKWQGSAPACIATLTDTSGPYSYSEILEILNTSEWNSPATGSSSAPA